MGNAAPGFRKYPEHQVLIEPCAERIRVSAGGLLLADTQRALRVRESRHDDVYYLPKADVHFEYLEPTERSTYCPFKGHASYHSVLSDSGTLTDCVWSYEAPYDECATLEGHVAFYQDRVTVELGEP
jgi:uncharacterized protein (DUF427 family)